MLEGTQKFFRIKEMFELYGLSYSSPEKFTPLKVKLGGQAFRGFF